MHADAAAAVAALAERRNAGLSVVVAWRHLFASSHHVLATTARKLRLIKKLIQSGILLLYCAVISLRVALMK